MPVRDHVRVGYPSARMTAAMPVPVPVDGHPRIMTDRWPHWQSQNLNLVSVSFKLVLAGIQLIARLRVTVRRRLGRSTGPGLLEV